MITNTRAHSTYTITEGVTEYPVGFQYDFNPDSTPQLVVYVNQLSTIPLEYGVDYRLSDDGLNIVLLTSGDDWVRLDIVRNIPMVQLSDYNIGRIDPEQIERDFDESVMRDQQIHAEIELLSEVPIDHEQRIQKNTLDIDAIESLIPNQATTQNQLADRNFVNSSITTSTATFRGTYASLEELQQVEADDNDYGFVTSVDATGNTWYNRYKYNGTYWVFEYRLNNSSYTADQWTAINSGVTPAHVSKINNLPNLIKEISVDSTTGAVTILASNPITTITIKSLFGGTAYPGTVTINGASGVFTPTTVSDTVDGQWIAEVA